MATVIDTLIVELGLDPKKLTQGQQEALTSFRRTQEGAKKQGDLIEQQAKRMVDSLSAVQRTILGVGALIGIRAGFRELATDITKSDAATGRLVHTLNMSSEKFTKWRGAAVLAGGTAEGFTSSVQTLSNDLQNFALTGESQFIPFFRSLGIAVADEKGKMRDVTDIMFDMARAVEKIGDPAKASTMLRSMGMDQGTINLLIRGEDAIRKLLRTQEELGVVSTENTKQAQELEKQWTMMSASAMTLARNIVNYLSPSLLDLMKSTRAWFDELTKGEFIAKNSLLGKVLGGMSIKQAFGEHDWGRGRMASIDAKDRERSAPAAPGATGAFKSQAEKEDFIRRSFAAKGVDPDVAMAVAKSEGFHNFNSTIPGEKSYGAFQLNISKNPAKPSLGDIFKQKTGLDPADPKNERATIDFAADQAANGGRGWSPWYGARNTGIDQWKGIPRGGAGMAAGNNDNRSSTTSSSSSETSIGTIVIQSQATDATGIARDIRGAIERNGIAGNAQSGPS